MCGVSSGEMNSSVSIVLQVTKRAKPIRDIIVFGDSLSYGHGLADPATQSWPAGYGRTFKHATLHTYAVSGADTRYVLTTELPRYRNETIKNEDAGDTVVFVWIGANDVKVLAPLGEFEANYKRILDNLSAAGHKDIVLMTIPDVSRLSVASDVEQGVNAFLGNVGIAPVDVKGMSRELITRYNAVIRHEAQTRGLPVIDMFEFMTTVPDSLLVADRVHPNAEGHKLIARRVQDDVDSFYPMDDLQ
jgi:lysophospholipase L1-like esterase